MIPETTVRTKDNTPRSFLLKIENNTPQVPQLDEQPPARPCYLCEPRFLKPVVEMKRENVRLPSAHRVNILELSLQPAQILRDDGGNIEPRATLPIQQQ